jgi:hypothetical protein
VFGDRVWNPAHVDPELDSRAATFENPTGGRGAGGTAHGGRKGAPNRRVRRRRAQRRTAYEATNPVAGAGWAPLKEPAPLVWGIAERVDDYCATAYVYCVEPQPVPRVDLEAALADIGRCPYEERG